VIQCQQYRAVASDLLGLEQENKPRGSEAVFLMWASDQIVVTGEVRRVAIGRQRLAPRTEVLEKRVVT